MSEPNQWIDLARLVAAGIVGGLISTYISHLLTKQRDKRAGIANRKRDFLAFMKSWRHEVERLYLVSAGYERRAGSLTNVMSEFIGIAESIRADYSPRIRNEWDILSAAITNCGPENFNAGKEAYEEMLKAFDDMISFVDSH